MNIQEKKYELIKFEDGGFSLDVNVSPSEDTVWLTQKDMSLLFNVSIDNISLHIKNIINDGELDQSVFEESSITASDGKKYKTKLYNLDMIISVGYRVKSRRGIIFRKWANSVLKQYLLIKVLDMPLLDTRIEGKNLVGKFISDIVLQVLSFVAENERNNIRERQAEGIRIAKEKGVKFGRPRASTPPTTNEILDKYINHEITNTEAASLIGVSRGTFFRLANARRLE